MKSEPQVNLQQKAAEKFVEDNLPELCREMVAFDRTGLFGTGKAFELRLLCSFAGASAQSLAISMIKGAAVSRVATSAI